MPEQVSAGTTHAGLARHTGARPGARFAVDGEFGDEILRQCLYALDLRTCRVCGCDHYRGCASGCSWVEEDLCSSCVGHEDQARTVHGRAVFTGRHGRQ